MSFVFLGSSLGKGLISDLVVAEFWMFDDFGDGEKDFSEESLVVDFRRELDMGSTFLTAWLVVKKLF